MAMTEMRKDEDTVLDLFFAEARQMAPEPSAAFLGRVLADAEAMQAGFLAAPAQPAVTRAARFGVLGTLLALFGGWGGLGGMATAAVAGVWIGFAGSGTLAQVTGYATTTTETATASVLLEGAMMEPNNAAGGPKLAMKGWVKAVFVLSVTLNLLVAGVLVGGFLGTERHPPRPPGGGDMTLGPLGDAFSREDRDAMRRAAERAGNDFTTMRNTFRADMDRLIAALSASPWDEAAVREELAGMRARTLRRMELGEQVMLERLETMTPEERTAYAERLRERIDRMDHRIGKPDDRQMPPPAGN